VGIALGVAALAIFSAGGGPPEGSLKQDPSTTRVDLRVNRPPSLEAQEAQKKAGGTAAGHPAAPERAEPRSPTAKAAKPDALTQVFSDPQQVGRSLGTVALFAVVSLAPAALLMLTAFVRINIVLMLLRQALGSPQVPGNQVLTALALLLTVLVMRPVGETVYARAVVPYLDGRAGWSEAASAASGPIKDFMIEQLERTGHTDYLWRIHDEVAEPDSPEPAYVDECPFGVVATAYLLSELTTALSIGFFLYLPFLVVDLVVSAVLAAMGLFMLPPSLVSMPLKLILFVLINGWLHVATMLLRGFGPAGGSA
jgi:flagellar biosynthetic protein FliP